MPCRLRLAFVSILILPSVVAFRSAALGQTIWSGYTKSFSKDSFTDDTLPANQDILTPNVTLTRGSSGGLINIASESSFSSGSSPAGTEWATEINNTGLSVDAMHHADLSFTNWFAAYDLTGTHGTSLPGTKAVVHLISDNIYLDLQFTSWTAGNGGGYSYLRAEPPAPAPTGDYNGNGVVDAADYVVWRKTFNQPVSVHGSGADGNSNGMIDAGDYTYWRQRFGNATGSGAGFVQVTAVPEPIASILFLTACSAVALFRRC